MSRSTHRTRWVSRLIGRITPGEVMNLAVGTAWLLWVLVAPGRVFAASISYHVLAGLAPEEGWALLIGILLGGHVVAISRGHHTMRRMSLLAWAGWWVFTAVTVLLSNPLAMGGPAYLGIALTSVWSYVRLSINPHLLDPLRE